MAGATAAGIAAVGMVVASMAGRRKCKAEEKSVIEGELEKLKVEISLTDELQTSSFSKFSG